MQAFPSSSEPVSRVCPAKSSASRLSCPEWSWEVFSVFNDLTERKNIQLLPSEVHRLPYDPLKLYSVQSSIEKFPLSCITKLIFQSRLYKYVLQTSKLYTESGQWPALIVCIAYIKRSFHIKFMFAPLSKNRPFGNAGSNWSWTMTITLSHLKTSVMPTPDYYCIIPPGTH